MTLVYLDVKKEDLNTAVYTSFSGKNQYEQYRFQGGGVTMILYTSGKLVVQGKKENLFNFKEQNQHLKLNEQKKKIKKEVDLEDFGEHIGSDETLKGDTFGGLVVVAAYFKVKEYDRLKNMGVKDSKSLTDLKIINIAENLIEYYNDRFEIIDLNAYEYNEKVTITNVTTLLDETHLKVGKKLKEKFNVKKQVVDKYPGCKTGDVMVEKGESKSLVIAAASIVARYYGLKQFADLSAKAGFMIPKGSTHVKEALEKLKKENKNLKEFVKVSFKNVKPFLSFKNVQKVM